MVLFSFNQGAEAESIFAVMLIVFCVVVTVLVFLGGVAVWLSSKRREEKRRDKMEAYEAMKQIDELLSKSKTDKS